MATVATPEGPWKVVKTGGPTTKAARSQPFVITACAAVVAMLASVAVGMTAGIRIDASYGTTMGVRAGILTGCACGDHK